MASTRGPRGIDTDLDELRNASANLVDALLAGSNDLSLCNNILSSETGEAPAARISESQAAFLAYDVAPAVPVPRAEGWNNTMNLNKELMDPKTWKSESQDSQTCAEQAINQDAPVAGHHIDSDKKAPSFFAWKEATGTAAGAAAAAVDAATGWRRVGEGWKSQDGIFYSDADLVADVLTASATAPAPAANNAAENIISYLGGEEAAREVAAAAVASMQEGSSGDEIDAIGDIYHTETEDSYRGTLSETPTTRLYTDKTTKPQTLSLQSIEDVRNWITEYDAQCLKSMNTQLSETVAGQASGMSSVAKAPLCFSWARCVSAIRADRASNAPVPIQVTPPYGFMPNRNGANWTSEYDASFHGAVANVLPPPAPAPAPAPAPVGVSTHVAAATAPAAVVPPYGLDKTDNSTVASEYDDNFRVGGKEPEPIKVKSIAAPASASAPASAARAAPLSVSETDFAALLRGFQALRSAVGAADADVVPLVPPKKQPTLRFRTESGLAYKWPTTNNSAVKVVPQDMGIFSKAETKEFITSEAKSHFVKAASAEGLVAMRASRGSSNMSNQSDPTFLVHKFVNVKAHTHMHTKKAVECDDDEIDAPDTNDNEEVGTLSAESEMYSGDEEQDEGETVDAVVVGITNDMAPTDTAQSLTAASSLTRAQSTAPAPVRAHVPSPQVGQDVYKEEKSNTTGSRLGETNPAPAPGQESPARAPDTVKLSFSKPKKAHLRGKALMLEKHKKASRDAAHGNRSNATRGSKKGSPVLRNSRYPGTSDAQNGRWHTEAATQFVWRPAPLQL